MPWGKHKDTPLRDVPKSYLRWLFEQEWIVSWPKIYLYLQEHEDELETPDDEGGAEGFDSYDDYRKYRGG